MSNSKERLELIIKRVKEVSEQLGIHPSELTQAQLFKFVDDITPWELRRSGGLSGIKKAHFPIVGKDLIQIREQKETSSYIRELETKLSDKEYTTNKVIELFKDFKSFKPKGTYKATSSKKMERELNLCLSDLHLGMFVNADAVGNTNEFNWEIAARRVASVIKDTCNYKADKRDEVKQLNVYLNGDLISGIIHNIGYQNQDLLTYQLNGLMHILGHAIDRLSINFNKVKVFMQSGNHEDSLHKRHGGSRVLEEKFDSYVGPAFYALSAMFRHYDNVEFVAAKTPYMFHNSIGGRILISHGDILFSKSLGNPGSNLNVKGLSDAINRFNAGEVAKGNEPVKLVLFGHVHVYCDFITFDGVRVMTNPSLSGVDGFAHSLGINHNLVGQLLFETTKDYIVGDNRLIQVGHSDKDISLDRIIPPYKNELVYEKN